MVAAVMSLLRGRKWISAREYADAVGKSMWVVHFELRTGRLRGRNLNQGEPKRPRWQVAASATYHEGS
jgi:hypothetical protein